MTSKIKNFLLIPVLLFFLNISNAQTSEPLKGKVIVEDGYTVYLIKYDKEVDYFIEDSLHIPVSVNKIKGSILFVYADDTRKFLEGSKNKKKNVFTTEIPREDKKIKNLAVLIKINDKKYVAAFGYPKS